MKTENIHLMITPLFEKCLVTIKNLNIINRKWQENFKPANDSIFRKMM